MKFSMGIALAGLIVASLGATPALAQMCNKTGEKTSGVNKTCFYNCAGGEAAQSVGLGELCPLSMQSPSSASHRQEQPRASTLVCIKKGETTSGVNKVCVYDCAGSEKVQTITMGQICPMSPR